MDILDKITTLRKNRNWTEYELAEKSGLTQSTISSWYRKNMLPTIPSLEKICNAFNITLSQFFLDEENLVNLSNKQLDLIKLSTKLSQEQLDKLIDFISTL